MRFELDSEQEQLRDSLRRLLAAEVSFERRRRAAETPWTPGLWRALAELGVPAITLPEAHGGFGQRPVALLPVLQELGRALTLEPFLATVALAATAVQRAGTQAQQQAWLPQVAEGRTVLALAHDESAGRHAPLWVEALARREGAGWVLDGHKSLVLHGAAADLLVVSARTRGEPSRPEGLALFLVQPAQAGVQCSARRLLDDTPAAEIVFRAAQADPLGDPADGPSAWQAIEAAQQAGLAAACAEALGVAEQAYALTVEYVQTRQQFGQPIAAKQAVRHRVAEMHVALDMVRSAALAGLLALEEEDPVRRRRELARAKMLVSRNATFIAQQGIQLHGGIGVTLEYAVGHCLRCLTVLEQLFGDGATHAARLGAALAAERKGA